MSHRRCIHVPFVVIGSDDTPRSCRGGYFLEMGIFFHHILRGLGFSLYMTGGRSRDRIDGIPEGEFMGWAHMVNIVRLPSGIEYYLDAAFGGNGPTSPLPLISGQVTKNLGSQEVRLIYDNLPKQTRKEQKVWIYQCRYAADKPWNSFTSFAELEFFQGHFEVMNRFTSWEAVEKHRFVVVKFIRNGETAGLPLLEGEGLEKSGDVFVAGKIMMDNNVVKLNMGGRTRVIDSFETEEGRFEALKKWFSIYLG
ncbi:Arylamine N-acetyltransferase [Penicillium expansum]|nr:Arylamine N-acetyltransferase [Penicillium expansum]